MRQQAQYRLNETAWSVADFAQRNELDGQTAMLKQEFEKGVRAGILLVLDFPRAQVEFLNERIPEMVAELEAQQDG